MMKNQKIFFTICIFILALLFAMGVHMLTKAYKEGLLLENKSEINNSKGHNNIKRNNTVNLLVMGVDDDGYRTDAILLLNFSSEYKALNIISICRDTRVRYKNKHIKINALAALAGTKSVISKVEQFTQLKINYYYILNFKGFRKLIDILGGVKFEIPFDMHYDDPSQNLHINLKKGEQILDGKKAEHLIRYRKGNKIGEGYTDGDLGRIRIQQEFIKALIEQKANIKNLKYVDDIAMELAKYSKTNIQAKDIRENAFMISKLDTDNIKVYTLPGEAVYIDGTWFYIIDESKLQEFNKNLYR